MLSLAGSVTHDWSFIPATHTYTRRYTENLQQQQQQQQQQQKQQHLSTSFE